MGMSVSERDSLSAFERVCSRLVHGATSVEAAREAITDLLEEKRGFCVEAKTMALGLIARRWPVFQEGLAERGFRFGDPGLRRY